MITHRGRKIQMERERNNGVEGKRERERDK